MKGILIVAMDEQWGIGKGNRLPWHLPADLRFFQQTTSGHVVVLGRKNYESIPSKFRPLPNRENAVLTRNKEFTAPNCLLFHSLEACLHHYALERDRSVFFIGGSDLYRQVLELDIINELYITHVEGRHRANVFFPKIDLSTWRSQLLYTHNKDAQHAHRFRIVKYVR